MNSIGAAAWAMRQRGFTLSECAAALQLPATTIDRAIWSWRASRTNSKPKKEAA